MWWERGRSGRNASHRRRVGAWVNKAVPTQIWSRIAYRSSTKTPSSSPFPLHLSSSFTTSAALFPVPHRIGWTRIRQQCQWLHITSNPQHQLRLHLADCPLIAASNPCPKYSDRVNKPVHHASTHPAPSALDKSATSYFKDHYKHADECCALTTNPDLVSERKLDSVHSLLQWQLEWA